MDDKSFRTIGRQLARELTDEEQNAVAGGTYSPNQTSEGYDDHTPTGDASTCTDCD